MPTSSRSAVLKPDSVVGPLGAQSCLLTLRPEAQLVLGIRVAGGFAQVENCLFLRQTPGDVTGTLLFCFVALGDGRLVSAPSSWRVCGQKTLSLSES